MSKMDKKNIEALTQSLNRKPKIAGIEENLTDKNSLNNAAFRKPEIAGTERSREDRNVKAGLAFREPRMAGMDGNLELKTDLSFEAPELKGVRTAGISPNLQGKEAEISKEAALREMKRRTLPPKEQMRLKGSAIKMDLRNLVSKFNAKKHRGNPETGKNKSQSLKKETGKGR